MSQYKIISPVKPLNLDETNATSLESILIQAVLSHHIPHHYFQQRRRFANLNKEIENFIQQQLHHYLNCQTKVTIETVNGNVVTGHVSFTDHTRLPKIITFHMVLDNGQN